MPKTGARRPPCRRRGPTTSMPVTHSAAYTHDRAMTPPHPRASLGVGGYGTLRRETPLDTERVRDDGGERHGAAARLSAVASAISDIYPVDQPVARIRRKRRFLPTGCAVEPVHSSDSERDPARASTTGRPGLQVRGRRAVHPDQRAGRLREDSSRLRLGSLRRTRPSDGVAHDSRAARAHHRVLVPCSPRHWSGTGGRSRRSPVRTQHRLGRCRDRHPRQRHHTGRPGDRRGRPAQATEDLRPARSDSWTSPVVVFGS